MTASSVERGGGASTKALESANKSDFTVSVAMLSQDREAGNGIELGWVSDRASHYLDTHEMLRFRGLD